MTSQAHEIYERLRATSRRSLSTLQRHVEWQRQQANEMRDAATHPAIVDAATQIQDTCASMEDFLSAYDSLTEAQADLIETLSKAPHLMPRWPLLFAACFAGFLAGILIGTVLALAAR